MGSIRRITCTDLSIVDVSHKIQERRPIPAKGNSERMPMHARFRTYANAMPYHQNQTQAAKQTQAAPKRLFFSFASLHINIKQK